MNPLGSQRDAPGGVELSRLGPHLAPGREQFKLLVEYLDPVIPSVGRVKPSRLVQSQSLDLMELSGLMAESSRLGHEGPVQVEFLGPLRVIRHVNIAVTIHRDPMGLVEITLVLAISAPGFETVSIPVEFLDTIIVQVGDIDSHPWR